ncbi:G2/M phase-specific E3 ubiquitin-protein ligase-like [Astyanax mexicanus]|uniref:G2/M phase-specific E3 ubiquitin-protein ligase-like n=1 Tax=Astyanax mexicanus TaxID=7994 RepID=A0A8T2LPI3_ASTMX|nr:G2/M phase-specific E3 ubiquitin-protein ligase-like [Astyanax mexicanus]
MITTVIIRRKHILQSACTALSRSYFVWHKVPNVEFVVEMAEDYGGPRREFFRLLMIELQQSFGVFFGKPGQLLFSYDQRAFALNKFYTAGKLIAWSIMHNGPGPRCLSRQLYLLMCGQKPDFSTFDVSNFQDEELQIKLEKVATCRTLAELEEIRSSLGDFIFECGVPNIYTASVADMPTIYEQIITHHLYHRVASMIHQFVSGLNSCGLMWTMVEKFWEQFLPMFTHTGRTLSRNDVQELFTINWSAQGSNCREQEEDTIYLWECWLMSIQEEASMNITYEDVLVFVTGADAVPPLGFQQNCQIDFYGLEAGCRRIPYSSTCACCLFLPRGIRDEAEFRDLMFTALRGSLGFGKV